MVCEVEAFKPELQVAALGEVEVLQRREVPGRDAGPSDYVPADIAPHVERIQSERLDVEPLARSRVAEIHALAGDGVRAVPAGIRAVRSGGDAGGEAAPHGHAGAEPPAADHCVGDAAA